MQNIQADLSIGYNRELPFENSLFELVLSIATIHYEESVNDVDNALREFERVTKNKGTVFIKTVAPKHFLYTKSVQVDDSTFKFYDSADLRNEQLFTFFPKILDFENLIKQYFPTVERARITESYPKKTLDFWLLKCSK